MLPRNLNHGLAKRSSSELGDANILFHQNGGLRVRSVTSDKYSRIWNYEVAERLLELQANGWAPARPTFRCSQNEAPALYASDHDMFAMVMMPNVTMKQPAGDKGNAPLYRGLIYSNSEVGAASLTAVSFWYNAMCGNHIIWGASGVIELNARHVGTVRERVQQWGLAIRRYADSSVSEDQATITAAATTRIAATKDELLDVLFGKRLGLSRKAIAGAYDAVIQAEDGDPLTKWGFVQGATRYSQTVPFADERLKLDRAAAKVMQISF